MANKKISALPSLAGSQVPLDLATLVDISALPASQNVKSTLNDLFAVVTRNITDGALRFGGFATPAVSAAGSGSIYFSTTNNRFEVSQNGGSYVPLAVMVGGSNGQLLFNNNGSIDGITGATASGANLITNNGGGTFAIGLTVAATEQLNVSSLNAGRVALSVNSLANSTVDLAQFNANVDDTATIANIVTYAVNSNGAAAAGFGSSITHQLESSSANNRTAAVDWLYWKVATDASRSSVRGFSTVSNAVTSERYLICPQRALTDNVATTVISIAIPSNTVTGGSIRAHIQAFSTGNAFTAWSGIVQYAGINSGGTVSGTATVQTNPVNINDGGGTMTVTWAAVVVGATIEIRVTADISFTATAGSFFVTFTVENNSQSAITVTP